MGQVCATYSVRIRGPVRASLVLVLSPKDSGAQYAVLGDEYGHAPSSGTDRLFARYGLHRSSVGTCMCMYHNCMCICKYICLFKCVGFPIYIYMCVCVCIWFTSTYIYIYIET